MFYFIYMAISASITNMLLIKLTSVYMYTIVHDTEIINITEIKVQRALDLLKFGRI